MVTWPKSTRLLLLCIFSLRLINALLVQTYFQPDEFYQSQEVAHRWVFGYGFQTWEWREQSRIRSPIHPLLLVPVYWLLKVTHLDETQALVRILCFLFLFFRFTFDLSRCFVDPCSKNHPSTPGYVYRLLHLSFRSQGRWGEGRSGHSKYFLFGTAIDASSPNMPASSLYAR